MTSTQSRECHTLRNEKRFIKRKLLTEKLKEWWMQRNEIKTGGEQRDFMGEREFEETFLKLQMSNNDERVQSFITRGWLKEISVSKLAECGFCYTGDSDLVVCFSCKGKLKDWDSRAVPLQRHLMIYPRCKFAKYLSKRAPKVTFDSPSIKIDESTTPCIEEELEDYFKSEFNRLMSFRNCSLSRHADPYELAAAGLYYLDEWSENGISQGKQEIAHHCCIFVNDKGNLNLTEEERKQADVFFPQVEKREKSLRAIAIDSSGGSDTVSRKYPIHPEYADKNKRLRTFKVCRSTFPILVESLAEAGFYSKDFKDEVVCFFCGGKLEDWVSQDNPWEEHARNFPDCQWMLEHIPQQNMTEGYITPWNSPDTFVGNLQSSLQSRIHSFLENGWSLPILVSELAEAGFFHSGETNTAECISCHVKINDWKDTDNPLQKHQTKSPNCEIVKALTEDEEFPHNTKVVFGKVDGDNETELTDEFEVDSASRIRKIGSSFLFGDKTSENEKFKSEYQRLLSYKDWPIRCIVDPFDLANAGFYWRDFERSVTVKCFACYGEISEWQIGEKPYRKHEKLYPSCPFINNLETGNKELTESERNKVSSLFRKKAEAASHSNGLVEQKTTGHKEVRQSNSDNRDVDNFHVQEIFSDKIPLNHTSEDSDGLHIRQEVNFSEGFDDPAAKYPQFFKETNRLDSFVNWPSNHCQRPEDLATAGFFYKGKKDLVVCFQCGGKLLDWEKGDNPWDEHARHYPKCQWLLKQKGMKFINSIQKKYDTSGNPKEPRFPEEDENLPRRVTNLTLADKTKPVVGKTSLLDEITKLKERSLCKICLDDDVELLILPCKHLVVCAECGERIESCPICRSYAEEKVRVFMP
ncbi:Baculoviral IAP repeat-containing protein 7-B [Holothuria leucospilota]|uniref:Baculoviral IAP repeat-containing protein 7-B n=1 Tax=Holothuria leucospilota TaxID=206669 RepID=A0A9Q0YQJ2_HOLLE|nr:Baculoviral IAP repeat-containing protein 7-B [Holothuria leucospilota]